jgi:protein phosphatase
MNLSSAVLSDPGRQRQINEDRAFAQVLSISEGEPIGLFIVCDGIGGHLAGEHASHWAVETIKRELTDFFSPKDPRATIRLSAAEVEAAVSGARPTRKLGESEIEKRVRKAVEKANTVVYGYSKQKPKDAGDAGTTATLALVLGNLATIANAGDSRTYLLRDQTLRQITQDHSLVASLAASGQIRPEEIFTHPQRNIIYRSLGQKNKLEVDVFQEVLQPGDYLLLCSDGLWEMVQDSKVMANTILRAGDLREACQRLVDAANAAGGEDNISVVLVKVD